MSLFEATGAPERLQFFEGQRLLATDLQGLEEFHREMRRLHLQTLHGPGIASGLAVSGVEDDRTVRIGPGYAVDDLGREIVLVDPRHEQVPPVAGGPDGTPVVFDLTISYRDDAFLEQAEERRGLCGTRGAVRLREEPVFCWVRIGDDGQPVDDVHKEQLLAGRRLMVARAQVRHCKLVGSLSTAERVPSRPPTQPYITSGRAHPEWLVAGESGVLPLAEACEEGDGDDDGGGIESSAHADADPSPESLVDVAVADAVAISVPNQTVCLTPVQAEVHARIDTTCAGFRIPPAYFARIDGPRLVTVDTEIGEAVVGYLDALVRVENPRAGSFEIHLTPVVAAYSESFPFDNVVCQILDWAVVWQGVE